jgi:pyridoxamine 5'-phosphate oxidase
VTGTVSRVPTAESAEYFRTRPHGSRIGAWASHQSSRIASREALEREVARHFAKYPEGTDVPLPYHWGGYRVAPSAMEFWQGRPNRLHDRIAYVRGSGGWKIERLSP